jgi:hypothetical protein
VKRQRGGLSDYFQKKRLRMHAVMTPEDRDRMIELCKRIARETDTKKLAVWIDELKETIQSKIRNSARHDGIREAFPNS